MDEHVSDPLVVQLADLCRANVTRAKWVFVPSHAVGRTIGERIALEGTGMNPRGGTLPIVVAVIVLLGGSLASAQ